MNISNLVDAAGVTPDQGSSRASLAVLLRRCAPFITVAVLAYPTLVWPLLEAEVVSLAPAMGQPVVDGPPSALLRLYFSSIFGLSLAAFIAARRMMAPGIAAPLLACLAANLAWAGLTVFWSVEPDITLRRFLLAIFVAGSLVLSVLAVRDHRRILDLVFWMLVVAAALSTVSVLTTAATPIGHAAFYPHKNYFAAIVCAMIFTAAYQIMNGSGIARIAALALLPLCVGFLIAAQSKTSLGLAATVPALAYLIAWLAARARLSPAIIVSGICAAVWGIYTFGAESGIWDFHAVATAIFGDPTLTQRTDIWAFAFKKIEERPWLGYGFEVFWGASLNSPSVREATGFVAQMPQGHNGYIDLIVHTGYVGLALFVAVALLTLHRVGRVAARSVGYAAFLLCLILFPMLHNGLESSWFRSFNLVSMLFILGIALAARPVGPTQ